MIFNIHEWMILFQIPMLFMPKQALLPLLQHLHEHDTAFPVSLSLTTLWNTPSLTLDSIEIVSYLSGSPIVIL